MSLYDNAGTMGKNQYAMRLLSLLTLPGEHLSSLGVPAGKWLPLHGRRHSCPHGEVLHEHLKSPCAPGPSVSKDHGLKVHSLLGPPLRISLNR